ncbi:MAG: lysine--tRNA ligase [Acidobacteria bacterium]|nr:MAG: lysine--tRNA ligase [Acidobacteriota bacterium]REK02621.1 MAG: lysine--tRNA ligase [Acidobacteriota bacterium]REK13576.1 MAG: lysine--tRNA ligase [Acidobacteriota bacterium]REK41570.1 MAG: lysine--tRNA ligase [Acidobacteriota bacterium]
MSIAQFEEIIPSNDQTEARKEHLEAISEIVGNAYPNSFSRSKLTGEEDTITRIVNYTPVTELLPELAEGERPEQDVKDSINGKLAAMGNVRVAGRLATPPRTMGKAAFVHLSDGKNRLQIYVRKQDAKAVSNDTGETLEDGNTGFSLFKLLDHGDFVGVEGFLFLTNTGELSVHVEKIQFLAKAMLPMPDKMHGIEDPEIKLRRRYADLIGSSLQVDHEGLTTREVFERRAKIISSMRRYLEDHGYIEVETPMLTPKATGAAAKPFETHHNALDITLYARIAPELYLKRLTVGGFEKVFELNRNFRNEGISYKHSPEFTMLEFYCAYMDVNGMMDFCEDIFKHAIEKANGGLKVNYEGKVLDFSSFERVPMMEAVKRELPDAEVTEENVLELFEEHVEDKIVQPTFIIDYPKSISPLSKASPQNPAIAERFELFVNGMEVANGFSELNDPREQYERFVEQMREREKGDEEAMVLDEDYIVALSYGMPPAAGNGIGIDRLVMLLCDKHSIRDVILFPHVRPERKHGDEEE